VPLERAQDMFAELESPGTEHIVVLLTPAVAWEVPAGPQAGRPKLIRAPARDLPVDQRAHQAASAA
jgi:hypothetical protein